MKYKVIKGTELFSVLDPDEEELKWDIVNIHFEDEELSYYVIESLKDNNEIITIGALPDEIEEVGLSYSETILENIKEEVNVLLEIL